jgi:hypothetical protein
MKKMMRVRQIVILCLSTDNRNVKLYINQRFFNIWSPFTQEEMDGSKVKNTKASSRMTRLLQKTIMFIRPV